MIWLLLNAWWLVPALVGVVALAVFLTAGPVLLRQGVKRIPPAVFQGFLLLLAVSLASSWLIGIGEARCQAAQEAREDKADVKAAGVAGAATVKAETATKTTRKESSDAQAEARVIVRSLPAACPGQPPRLRELGESAVEAARRSLPATADG